MELPLDEEDRRYHQSFTVEEADSDAAHEFFERFGVLIIRDVLNDEQIAAQIKDMDDWLEEHGKGTGLFGMPNGVNALFRPALLELRQSLCVLGPLASALGLPVEDVIVSHDRWLKQTPAKDPNQPLTVRNLHLDFNPWEYFDSDSADAVHKRLDALNYTSKRFRAFITENSDIHRSFGSCVQGMLNLSDLSDVQCGGTIVVPGTHAYLESFFFGQEGHIDDTQRRVGPIQYKFSDTSQGQHVRMRPGSLLIWDQRIAHGGTPNLHPNQIRRGIPVRAYGRHVLSKRRGKERGGALARQIKACGFEGRVTDLGRRAFGLDLE